MNISTVTLCLLPSILLVIFKCTSVRSAKQPCRGASCPTFQCPGQYNCSCARESGGAYELLCPKTGLTSVLSVSFVPERYIQIQCTSTTHFTDYELLRGLEIGPVTSVNFRLCPLPNMSLLELTKAIGVNSTSILLFQSYKNLSNTLEKKHLVGLENLKRLYLSSNGLTDLPEDLLRDLHNLAWLDLRGNNVHLHKYFFTAVPNLEVLELGNNHLRSLEPGIFGNLTKLKLLNLWKNQLRNLTREVFNGLASLESLDLNANDMTSLKEDVFQDLTKLRIVNLFANNFTSLPGRLFSNSNQLEVIRLYDNRQTLSSLPEYFLSNLTKLKEVYLMKNNISSIPENIFWESVNIQNLTLHANLLEKIPENVFRDQKHLKTLDLSYNLLLVLPDNVFKNLEELEYLKLGYNLMTNISRDAFHGLKALQELDLEHNRLIVINADAFLELTQLRIARLSHNKLSFLNEQGFPEGGLSYTDLYGTKSPLRHSSRMEALYLANNSITEVMADWRITMTKLKTLDLSYNKISRLVTQDIQFLSLEISVDLRNNNISRIELDDIQLMAPDTENIQRTRKNVRVLLEGNPLICDCRAFKFFQYLEDKLPPEILMLLTLVPGNLRCVGPYGYENKTVSEVSSRELTCRVTFNNSYCTHFVRRADKALIVDCAYRNLTNVPEPPEKIKNLDYTNHTELILTGNHLTKVPSPSEMGYKNVTHLYLSRNDINEVHVEDLTQGMEVLELDHNHLERLNENVSQYLSNLTHLRRVSINNNPWKCDCSNRGIINLIQFKFEQIPYLANVTCNEMNQTLSKLSLSDLCPGPSRVVIALTLTFAIFAVIIAALAAFYYKYHKEIKVWLYAHRLCLWFVTEEELDKDKLYDAFISYSHKDEDFVINTLVPGLETGPMTFKLCLHYRDWIAGEWIPNQIARSVEDSRRTLVVLSPNFLESVWGRLEFQAAHKQALSEGRARVIVILFGDIGPTDDLDPELKTYISMNTYVKWGDPWFWRKLRYALPHPPNLVKNNLQLLKRRASRREKHFIDDKLELIHTLDSPTTPPGATTPPAEVVTAMETVTPIMNGTSRANGHAKPMA